MKKKMPTVVKDGIIGFLFGVAGIIPGIAGGTILLITGVYKKVVDAIAKLFSKDFLKNLLILIPFGIGAVLAVAALIFPLNLAIEHCMFAIVCLFAGLIIGTIPTITDKIKNHPIKKSYIFGFSLSVIIAAFIGVSSVIFETNALINDMFASIPFYLFIILFVVGFVAASGLIVPGFSGSMLLLAMCLYQPILLLLKFENPATDVLLFITFFVGAVLGFIFFSKMMSHFIKQHTIGTYCVSFGLIIGSLVAIFVNGKMFSYLKSSSFGLLDKILAPILLVLGLVGGYIFVVYIRKHPETEADA